MTCRQYQTMLRMLLTGMCIVLNVAAGAAAYAAAHADSIFLFDIPRDGDAARIVASAGNILELKEQPVVWFADYEDNDERPIGVIVTSTGSPTRTELADDLPGFVRDGGGLVYLVSSEKEAIERDAEFLTEFDLSIAWTPDNSPNGQLSRHVITHGVDAIQSPAIPFRLTGRDPRYIVRQRNGSVAVAADYGEGRIVVMPVDMMGAASLNSPEAAAKVRLMTQALQWVAAAKNPNDKPVLLEPDKTAETTAENSTYKQPRPKQWPDRLTQPDDDEYDYTSEQRPPMIEANTEPLAVELPMLSSELSATAVCDMNGDKDNWPEVGQIVREVVTAAGLELHEMEYDKKNAPEPLLTGIPEVPSVLVIGSWREFSYAEAQAVGNHVRAGGALLAIANSSAKDMARFASFNRILSEFGLAVRLTRPEGRAEVAETLITDGIHLQDVPKGISIWSFNDWELVTVDNEAIASAYTSNNGKIFVIDGSLLLAEDTRVSGEWRQLLSQGLNWLLGRQ